MMNASFPKSERLCSRNEIDELFANGETRHSGGFTVKYLRVRLNENVESEHDEGAERISTSLNVHPQPMPKVLVSIPKRFQKKATDRNRSKRKIREVYRKHKTLYLSGSNISSLAIIFASTKVTEYSFVEEHLPKLLEKIK